MARTKYYNPKTERGNMRTKPWVAPLCPSTPRWPGAGLQQMMYIDGMA